MNKHDVAKVLEEIGVYLEVQGANPFRIRAYYNAARSIENLEEDLDTIVAEERLEELPGIGKDLSETIMTLVQTGRLPFHEKLKKSIPESLISLLRIQGLGGKKIKVLYDKLGIETIEELAEACQQGKIAELRGFGEKTQANIQRGIAKYKTYGLRVLWLKAKALGEQFLQGLNQLEQVEKVEIAGSFRRKLETVGDLDFLVASSDPEPIMEWFTQHYLVSQIIAKGTTRSSVKLQHGLQADLRIIPKEQYAFASIYFTGSKDHNIQLRNRANKQGYTLSEYGLDALDPKKKRSPFPKRPKNAITEEQIYNALGLAFILPELRENMGEIVAAEKGKLPRLVESTDIRGVFHCHTTDSDGHNTLEEMVAAAQDLGLDYIGISDHSKSSYQAHGMDEERLFDQIARIRKLNQSGKYKIHVFAGLECDILIDGTLDFADEILKELDFVITSVHRSFKIEEKKMTARIIKAVENPYMTIVGHITGRLLLRRDPYAVNIPKVIDACIANGKIIELNCHPMRLDMDWRYWHKAKEKGLKCSIDPDAHSVVELEYYHLGVNCARKGWLEKNDILTTLPLQKVKNFLKRD